MSIDPSRASHDSTQPRLFLREPGWRIGQKVGSVREFCYMTAPGQDYYHRLLDGELFVFHGDEKLCLACADRRGLLSQEARPLRDPVQSIEIPVGEEEGSSVFRLERADRSEPSS
jgi:hypothetical protein